MASMLITETFRTGANITGDLAEFEFTSVSHSMTQDSLDLAIKVNTSKETPPGAEEPVEQVLSTEWEDVEFHGEWKDQWAGEGFANRTYEDFARMTLRTPTVRIIIGTHILFGLITSFKIKWRLEFEIGWSFTLSVHKNATIGSGRSTPISPQNTIDIARRLGLQAEILDRVTATFDDLDDVQFSTEDIDDAEDDLDDLFEVLDDAKFPADAVAFDSSSSLDFDTLVDQTQQKLLAVAAAFGQIRSTAQENLLNVKEILSADVLAYEDVVATLKFEEWSRTQYTECTRLIGEASAGEIDVRARASRRIRGIHRVSRGDTLDRVSLKWYGSPDSGRLIRDANNLDSILLHVGDQLIIPDISK